MPWLTDDAVIRAIRTADPKTFVVLCNAILRAEAARLGIPISHFKMSLNISEPDGGLDASCESAPHHGGLLILAPDVGYQFRGGVKAHSANKVATEDILNERKPRPREYLRAGHSFVFMTAADRGDDYEREIRAAVREKVAGEFDFRDEQIVVFTAGRLANQVLAVPALARHIGFSQEVPENIDEWGDRPTMANPFQIDADLNARIADLRAQIETSQTPVRLLGPAGGGKTRSVLEALRGSTLASTVVYLEQLDDRARSFLDFVKRAPGVRCVAVVDEVEEAPAARLVDEFASLSGDLRLVLVGRDALEAERTDVLQAPAVSESVITEIITSLAPGIPREQAATAASACGKSPKFAVLVAEGLRLDPGLVVRERLLQDGTVQSKIDLLLPFKDDTDRNALAAVALLERLGWDDEARAESTALFESVRLDPRDARGRVEALHSRFGIAPLAGRYRYVSPELLGDHLATRFLSRWDTPDVERFIEALTPVMQDSFTRRLRRLGKALRNHKIVEEVILGERGPFRSLEELERDSATTSAMLGPRNARRSRLLRNLAGAFPVATLAAVERMLAGASDAEVADAKSVRRDLVWAIEELLWMEATFERAANVLLRLAVNENETWANNATGTWTETFQMLLGRTAAAPPARIRVLARAARSEDRRERVLVAKALKSALNDGHVTRHGMPPSDVPSMPKESWRPATFGELADAVIGHVEIAGELARDQDREVRELAASALANAVRPAINLPRVGSKLIAAARGLADGDYDLRRPIVDRVAHEVEWRSERDPNAGAEPEVKTAVAERLREMQELARELAGADFSSRFRGAVSAVAWKPEEVAELRARLVPLIDEAIARPSLMDSEWAWLANPDSRRASLWASVLGERDGSAVFEPTIRAWSERDASTDWWLVAYDFGRFGAAGQDALDRRAQELAGSGYASPRMFAYLARMGPTPARTRLLLDVLRKDPALGTQLRSLAYSGWRDVLTWEFVVVLARAVDSNADVAPGLIDLLVDSLKGLDTIPDGAKALALDLIDVVPATRSTDMDDYDWHELATKLIDTDPERVARAALERLLRDRSSLAGGRDPVNVLDHAWAKCDQCRFFETTIAPILLGNDARAWTLQSALEKMPLRIEALGAEYLLAWVAEDPKPRAYRLAEVLGRPSIPMTELEATLLERYDEHGVGSAYAAAFGTGSWAGSIAGHIAGQLDTARKWLDDPRAAAREWGQRLVRQYEAELRYAQREEEEERFE